MTLFYLAGLLSYVSGRTQPSRFKVYGLTPLFFILALSVKETAVTFPFALLLWEYTCGGRWQRALKPQWPSWLVLAIGSLIFLFSASYVAHMERSAQLNSLQGNAATQLFAFVYLLRQWAAPLWLNIDPELILQRDFSASTLPLLFLAVLAVTILASLRRRPWLSFALAWALLQLLPLHLFLPRLDIANERQMYLAGWPLLLALAIELTLWLNSKALRLTATALLLALASLTVLHNRDYRDEISLWQSTVAQSPHKARVHNNLGYAYLLAHRYGEARQQFNAALQLDPGFYRARFNLYRQEEEENSQGKKTAEVVTDAPP
jgi:tetratricopeptide (TPR) repeat protein